VETNDLSRLRIDRSAPDTPRRKRRFSSIVAALGVAVAAALGLFARFGGEQTVEVAAVTTAYPSQAATLLNATGFVVAQRKAAVASKATGRLVWLGVAEGSRVKTGDIVARLENGDVSASLEQARANVKVTLANLEQGRAELRDAEVAYQRSADLVAKKFIAESAHDAAIARYNKARAGIASLESAIAVARAVEHGAAVAVEQTVIRAPFDGVVLTKSANVGDIVTPFSSALDAKGAVVTMADMRTLEVEADVSESNLQKIAVDQPCEIQLDAFPDARFQGFVSRMVPTVDRAKATVLVKVRFKQMDSRVLPEMAAKVAFLSKEMPEADRRPVTVTQPGAIAMRDGKSVVFVIDTGKVRLQPVETGAKIGDLVEVRAASGLKTGDRLVLRPPGELRDGDAVRVASK
jgi:RND family efflux transporter MFP subunit